MNPRQKHLLTIVLIVVLCTMAPALLAQDAPDEITTQIFLPLISGGGDTGGQTGETPTPTATASPTASPSPTVSPTPSPTPSPTATVDDGSIAATGDQCPAGMHLEHKSGMSGIVSADTFTPTVSGWLDYRCVPDESIAELSCSDHGTPLLIDGVATCSCDEGFVGSDCADPAPVVEAPAALIAGGEQSLTSGDVISMQANATGVQAAGRGAVRGTWQIVTGEGCLRSSRDTDDCLTEFIGDVVFFQAPADVATLATTTVHFVPAAGGPPIAQTVLTQPPGYIPVNGYGRPELEPVLEALDQFMKDHCIGAATIGVSHYGQPVGVWGLGKVHGRASSTIFNPECPDDTIDPHYPAAPNVTYDMPFPIGSVSKNVAYAVGRWAIKGGLQAHDTDLDLIALSQSRLVSAIRNDEGSLQLDLWAINSAGIQQHLAQTVLDSARDFTLTSLSTSRFAVGVRQANDNLRIHLFDLDSDQLVERSDAEAGTVRQIELTAVAADGAAADRLVAAVKAEDDKLKLIVYTVSPKGVLTRAGDVVDELARDFAIVNVGGGDAGRVVTAIRRADHTLRIKSWTVDAAGNIAFAFNKSIDDKVHGLRMTRLNNRQVVVAISTGESSHNASLKLHYVDIRDSGLIDLLDDDSAGVVGTFDLVARGPSGFAVVAETQGGALKVINWLAQNDTLQRQGEDSAGIIHGVAVDSQIYGSETPLSVLFTGVRSASHELKIVAWNATGPTPQRLDADVTGDAISDYAWTDSDMEALYLTGYELPSGLLPERLDRYFSGRDPLPNFNPGIAGVTSENDGTGETNSCPMLGDFADAQWRQVQVKHVYSHRTGLPRSAPSYNGIVKDHLDTLRGLNSPSDYAEQEALLRAQWGNASVEQGRAELGWSTAFAPTGNTEGYLLPFGTLEEILVVLAARCLPHPLGDYEYSNTDPSIVLKIIEHITGMNYATADGFPGTHEESALYHFFLEELGIVTSQTNNIFAASYGPSGASNVPNPGPTGRGWDDNQNGTAKIYNLGWDRKRPHCVIQNVVQCLFDEWASATNGRINWYWKNEQVRLPYWSQGQGAATGGLRVEPLAFLRYMSQYWVSGYGTNPLIGEARNNNWSLGVSHNGSGGGMYAEAIQMRSVGSCNAEGVDVFVALNQSADKTGADYDLRETISAAICSVDWDEVEPYAQFVLLAQFID